MNGFTLIESIIIIVVVSIAAVALLGIFTTSIRRSVDPMLRMQATAIAQGYLEEALLKAYDDPEGDVGCEGSRALYDDVLDYNCISNIAVSDQSNNTLTGLADYRVTMTVTDNDIGVVDARRVEVSITHASQPLNIILRGYRANY
jgi:MSHA pilin protein MshD